MDTLIRVLADGSLIAIVFIATASLLVGVKHKDKLRVYPYVVLAGLSSLLVGKLASLIYQSSLSRPFLEQGLTPGAAFIDNPGFPSDHVLLASVVVLAVYFVTKYKKVAIGLGILTLFMGLARVAALVHTPVDILGGLVAAAVGALWYYQLQHART